jgi:hypothetical protein
MPGLGFGGSSTALVAADFIGPPDDMPSEAEAEESHQAELLETIPHYVNHVMSEATRQKFFAELKKNYPVTDLPAVPQLPSPADPVDDLIVRAQAVAVGLTKQDRARLKTALQQLVDAMDVEDHKSNGAKPDLVAAARAAKAKRDDKRVERVRARHG